MKTTKIDPWNRTSKQTLSKKKKKSQFVVIEIKRFLMKMYRKRAKRKKNRYEQIQENNTNVFQMTKSNRRKQQNLERKVRPSTIIKKFKERLPTNRKASRHMK